MKTINYKKASMYYLIGNLFNKGMSFLTVPIFTRILSTYDYGLVTTYNSWIGIISMILGFALHMGIRATFTDFKDNTDDFMSVTIFFTVISAGLMSLMIITVIVLLDVNISITLVILCLLQGFASALVLDYTMYLMMLYRFKLRTLFMILPNLISVIVSVFVVRFVMKTNLYMGRIVPTALINIAFGILVLILIFKKSHKLINFTYIKYGLAISAPLIIHGIALNILSQSDRTMITWYVGASQTGIYSIVYNFGMIATVISSSLEGVWVPWFTERMKAKDINTINSLAIDYVNLMTYIFVCLLLISPEILKILASKPYWEGISIIPPVVLSNYIIFMYTMYVNVEHFYKRTLYITLNTLIAAVTNIILNILFIPTFGYVAAAYTTFFSYVISLILHERYAKKLEYKLYPLKTFIQPLGHIFLTIIIFYIFLSFPVVRWIIMFVYLITVFFVEHKRIFELCPEIEKKFQLILK